MLGEVDGVAGALADDLLDCVLVKLVLEALGAEDGLECDLSFGGGGEQNVAALALGDNEFERVPAGRGGLLGDGALITGVFVAGVLILGLCGAFFDMHVVQLN